MNNFFESYNLKSAGILPNGKQATCIFCGLFKKTRAPKIEPYGNKKAPVLIIAGSPSREEGRAGKPFKSEYGMHFRNALHKINFNIYKDALNVFSIRCFVRKPQPHHVLCCKRKLTKLIKEVNPKVIFLLGDDALYSIIGSRLQKDLGSIHKWRGYQIPDREFNAYICPIYHPDFVFGGTDKNQIKLLKKILLNDFKKGVECLDKVRPNDVFRNDEKYITYVTDDISFKTNINRIKKSKLISFDYETTGLKPHHPDQKIICTATAFSGINSVVWMNTPERNKEFKKILRSTKIKKSAHSLMFENVWSTVHIGKVRNWLICTMNTNHILDQRNGINSLKFLVYVNFGVMNYDSEISDYLKSDTKQYGGNGINDIEKFIKKFGEKKLMTYCGLDALYGYKLTTLQLQQIQESEDVPI